MGGGHLPTLSELLYCTKRATDSPAGREFIAATHTLHAEAVMVHQLSLREEKDRKKVSKDSEPRSLLRLWWRRLVKGAGGGGRVRLCCGGGSDRAVPDQRHHLTRGLKVTP
ncbi:hypothetical protein E2C01_086086 [Portunus trituberculatus]|uniref:Uncharacterized protein n=1 Tax=Portunus trituberculatus TaxID=210409 RepID=A0A5B7J9B8_PORTR|nr:hypothetical protein [Portunus trituberculatus]